MLHPREGLGIYRWVLLIPTVCVDIDGILTFCHLSGSFASIFVSLISRVARYTPSSTYKMGTKIAQKSVKAN